MYILKVWNNRFLSVYVVTICYLLRKDKEPSPQCNFLFATSSRNRRCPALQQASRLKIKQKHRITNSRVTLHKYQNKSRLYRKDKRFARFSATHTYKSGQSKSQLGKFTWLLRGNFPLPQIRRNTHLCLLCICACVSNCPYIHVCAWFTHSIITGYIKPVNGTNDRCMYRPLVMNTR